jgi:hypothetical protein
MEKTNLKENLLRFQNIDNKKIEILTFSKDSIAAVGSSWVPINDFFCLFLQDLLSVSQFSVFLLSSFTRRSIPYPFICRLWTIWNKRASYC